MNKDKIDKIEKRTDRIIDLMKTSPTLHNPDKLSDNIMDAIESTQQLVYTQGKKAKVIRLIRKSLAVASVGLILIFGIEQYIVFDKITKLEEDNSKISRDQINIGIQHVIIYNTGMQIESFTQLFKREPSNQAHLKIKARVMFSRLSSLAFNEIDNLRIRQLRQTITSVNIN